MTAAYDPELTGIAYTFPAGAHGRNQNAFMGLDAECIECGRKGRLLGGDWKFLPGDKDHPGGKVYCGGCEKAEAHE